MSLECMYCGKTGTALTAAPEQVIADRLPKPTDDFVKPIPPVFGKASKWQCFDNDACLARQKERLRSPIVKENENARLRQQIVALEGLVVQLRHDLEALARHVHETFKENSDRLTKMTAVLTAGAHGEEIDEGTWYAHMNGLDCGRRPCAACAPSDGT